MGQGTSVLIDAFDIDTLSQMDVVVTCQGGSYTEAVRPKLAGKGWAGYWIDAASTLRMDDQSIIVLDPVNMPVIEEAIAKGIKNFVGGKLHGITDADGFRRAF